MRQARIGLLYRIGQGVAQDYDEAERLWRLAAEQGFADAQSGLGFMYFNGEGVPENDAEAVKWWRKAAEQGYADAHC